MSHAQQDEFSQHRVTVINDDNISNDNTGESLRMRLYRSKGILRPPRSTDHIWLSRRRDNAGQESGAGRPAAGGALTRRSARVALAGKAARMEEGEGGLPACELPATERPELLAPEAARQLLNLATAFCRLPAEPLERMSLIPMDESGMEAIVCMEGSTREDTAAQARQQQLSTGRKNGCERTPSSHGGDVCVCE